jgi:hydrogenase nickel incorporation protein HypA/HybF
MSLSGEVALLHELAISEAIVSEVCDHVGTSKVSRVVLEIGRLSAVVPDAVRFCFDLAAQGTVVEGAALEIIEIPAFGHCRQCGSSAKEADSLFVCDACGGIEFDFLRGRELRIKSVEVS